MSNVQHGSITPLSREGETWEVALVTTPRSLDNIAGFLPGKVVVQQILGGDDEHGYASYIAVSGASFTALIADLEQILEADDVDTLTVLAKFHLPKAIISLFEG